MTISIRDSLGFPHNITQIMIRDDSGTLRNIAFLKIRDDSNTLRTVWQRLNVTGETYVEGYGNSNSPIAVTTATPNPVVVGGTAPFTYSWSGPGGGWTILQPSQRNTAFRRSNVLNGASYTGTFTLTVTDAGGFSAQLFVTAYVENNGGFS